MAYRIVSEVTLNLCMVILIFNYFDFGCISNWLSLHSFLSEIQDAASRMPLQGGSLGNVARSARTPSLRWSNRSALCRLAWTGDLAWPNDTPKIGNHEFVLRFYDLLDHTIGSPFLRDVHVNIIYVIKTRTWFSPVVFTMTSSLIENSGKYIPNDFFTA